MAEPEQLVQNVAEIAKDLRRATIELTQTTTVLRQHIGEQRSISARRDAWERKVDSNIVEHDRWIARADQRIIEEPVDHKDFVRLEKKVDELTKDVTGMGRRIAGWSGGIAAVVTIAGFLFKWLIG